MMNPLFGFVYILQCQPLNILSRSYINLKQTKRQEKESKCSDAWLQAGVITRLWQRMETITADTSTAPSSSTSQPASRAHHSSTTRSKPFSWNTLTFQRYWMEVAKSRLERRNSFNWFYYLQKNRASKSTFVWRIKTKLLVEYGWIKHLKFSLYRMLTTVAQINTETIYTVGALL